MQQSNTLTRNVPPHITMQILIHKYGAWTAFAAFLKALRGVARTRNDISHLSDHLRRDMGLAERCEPPPVIRGPWM